MGCAVSGPMIANQCFPLFWFVVAISKMLNVFNLDMYDIHVWKTDIIKYIYIYISCKYTYIQLHIRYSCAHAYNQGLFLRRMTSKGILQ